MSRSKKTKKLYEGKAKILYEGIRPGTLIQYFKDDITAGNAEKHEVISGKGVINNRISEFFMQLIEEMGINTHFIDSLNMREQLIIPSEVIPLEVVVRNYSAGQFAKRLKMEEGVRFPAPLVEFYMKSDEHGDPLITTDMITMFEIATSEELKDISDTAKQINDILRSALYTCNITLVDFKLEFGRVYNDEDEYVIILVDEISPDTCRLWDMETGKKLDKDVFRHDLGDVMEGYREVARRIGVLTDSGEGDPKGGKKPRPKKDLHGRISPASGIAKAKKTVKPVQPSDRIALFPIKKDKDK